MNTLLTSPQSTRSWSCRGTAAVGSLALLGAAFVTPCAAQEAKTTDDKRIEQLKGANLEDLLNMSVTSVSKRAEDPFKAAAAVSSITGDDIRRSGARTLPDALRLAPGMSVSQADGSKWSVASRGLNDIFTNRLLVLVDGRTVYSPGFAGVFWAAQDVLLEDIEHIEVIRGPGGTLWGANAVNGVINIITKDTRKVQGAYFSSGGGTHERVFGEARYVTSLSEEITGRIYFKYADREEHPTGTDRWDTLQGGMRLDWHLPVTHITLRGDLFDINTANTFLRPIVTAPFVAPEAQRIDYSGGNALLKATHDFSEASQVLFQAYYSSFREKRFDVQTEQLVDVELQHWFDIKEWWRFIYGANYRYLPTDSRNNNYFTYAPNTRDQQIFSGFVQTDFLMFNDRLRLTLGGKLEANDITGVEMLPNARVSWFPSDKQTVWAAVSRAVQIPSRASTDLTIPLLPGPAGFAAGFPIFPSFTARPSLGAQDLVAYEFGYRVRPRENLNLDAATFYNDYTDAFGAVLGAPVFVPLPAPHFLLPITSDNSADFNSYGFELSTDWRPKDWLRLTANYSFIKLDLDNGTPFDTLTSTPQQQVSLRSSMDLPANLSLDLGLRFVDRITANGVAISAYSTMDARLAWNPSKNWGVALVGQNLFDPQRFQYSTPAANPTQATPVPRGVFLQLTARF